MKKMESYNSVQLFGSISGKPTVNDLNGFKMAIFTVVTNQMWRKDGEKVFEQERHTVKLKDSGTIADSLVNGKSVLCIGRLKYGPSGAYVKADSVIFTDKRGVQ